MTPKVLKAGVAVACGYETFAIVTGHTTISEWVGSHGALGLGVGAGVVVGLAVHFWLGRRP